VAQDDKRKPNGKASGSGGTPTGSGGKQPAGKKSGQPAGKPAGRQSVAAARQSSGGNNRTQLIIGVVAIAVILVIIIGGVIYTQRESQVQADGYGPSTQSVATVGDDGLVTVAKPESTPVTIDIYADALCPVCAQFEKQFGQQIGQAIDEGKLAVNYHMLTFLNPKSFSGDYSTRAAAALLCVAQEDGSQPGVYMALHSTLFSTDNQPAESGTEDFTNDELADLATAAGAGNSADCIRSGQNMDAAAASATTSSEMLSAATGRVATPTVLYQGQPIAELTADWLTNLLAAQ
jgi:protein-disulfide isomerase